MSNEKEFEDIQDDEQFEYEDDDDYGDDYYNYNDDDTLSDDDDEGDSLDKNNEKKILHDIEYFEYTCMTMEDVDKKFDQECSLLGNHINIPASVAELILQLQKWRIPSILPAITDPKERAEMLKNAGVHNASVTTLSNITTPPLQECGVCFDLQPMNKLASLPCSHTFCRDCWQCHIEYTVNDGMIDGIECMEKGCGLRCPGDFIEQLLTANAELLEKFNKRLRTLRISAHYQLRFCVGADCPMIMCAETPKARLVKCTECHSSFCFDCGNDYHSPTDCGTMTKWLMKCRDDSETANYIRANTKNCPHCHTSIEKNGGCNHINCRKCKQSFCWMCLQDWKIHGYNYSCSKYVKDPLADKDRAREALKKYLFHFERWENHRKSLLLEEETRKKIQKQIEEKVMRNEGTWIDWQYLLRAGELLAKCRLTLQNTYPLAYYGPPGAETELFEYQQAQLELEIEELSWKLERAGSYQRGEIENQMDVAGKRRYTLLNHLLKD